MIAHSIKAAVVLLCIFVSLAVSADAQNLVSATILGSEGTVRVVRLEPEQNVVTTVAVVVGATLRSGDVVRTDDGGRLVIGLSDGSQAVIAAGSTVEIKDFNGAIRTIFNVLRGKIRIRIQKLGGKPNPYRVTTPTTVIAVRGTIFDVFVTEARVEVFVNEGSVGVFNLFAPERQIVLDAGKFTVVGGDRPPRAPKDFKPDRNDEFFRPISERKQKAADGLSDGRGAQDPNPRGVERTNGSGRGGNGRNKN